MPLFRCCLCFYFYDIKTLRLLLPMCSDIKKSTRVSSFQHFHSNGTNQKYVESAIGLKNKYSSSVSHEPPCSSYRAKNKRNWLTTTVEPCSRPHLKKYPFVANKRTTKERQIFLRSWGKRSRSSILLWIDKRYIGGMYINNVQSFVSYYCRSFSNLQHLNLGDCQHVTECDTIMQLLSEYCK